GNVETLPDGRVSFSTPAGLDQRLRRAFVRAVFAFVEGVVSGVKHEASLRSQTRRRLTAAEQILITERLPDLDEKGVVASRPANLRPRPNLRFAFELFAGLYGHDW